MGSWIRTMNVCLASTRDELVAKVNLIGIPSEIQIAQKGRVALLSEIDKIIIQESRGWEIFPSNNQ